MIDRYGGLILVELYRKRAAKFSELATIVKNPRTLSKKLKMLGELGLVRLEDGAYTLSGRGTKAAKLAVSWFELIETTPNIKNLDRVPHLALVGVLRRYCEILLQHFGKRLLGILLFGSVARGDWTPNSDVDLLVIVEGWQKPSWERGKELVGLRHKLRATEEFSRAVGAGCIPIIQHYPLDRDEALRFHRVYLDACMDGIILFERDGFLTQILESVRKKLIEQGAKRVSTPDGKHYWVLTPDRKGGGGNGSSDLGKASARPRWKMAPGS
jgi:hypothetical protein